MLKNHVFGSLNLNNSEIFRLSFEDIFLGTLDTYTKKMNPPSAVLGGGMHGTVCWLIAYRVIIDRVDSSRGVPRIWHGGGPRIFFFRFGNLHVAKRHAAHGEAMRFARGFGGMPPREIFLKWCNLVRFGVYFDQILSLKISKITIFYIKILKIAIFFI